MNLITSLDDALDELLGLGMDITQIAKMMMDEDFRVYDDRGELIPLVEVVVRKYRTIAPGVRVLVRKQGVPSGSASARARRSAMQTKFKRARTRKQTNRTAAYKRKQELRSRWRRSHRAKSAFHTKHGPPRRGAVVRSFRSW